MQLIKMSFSLEELEAIARVDTLYQDSCDFGPCACGQFKHVLYLANHLSADFYSYCIYSHGEILFKLDNLGANIPNARRKAVAQFLQEAGCKLRSY